MAPVPPSGRAGARAGGRPDPPLRPNAPRSAAPDACPGVSHSALADTRLHALLSDLGAHLQHGDRIPEPLPRLPTGLDEIDRLLRGGFPLGRLCEISGSPSSGRTSLALSLLAQTTRSGECAAVIDPSDAFDPASAAAIGVDLDRVLWVGPAGWSETLRATERLLDTEGFPLIVLDLALATGPGGSLPAAAPGRREGGPARLPSLLLARRAAARRTALVLLSSRRMADSQAEIVLEMQPARAHFSHPPSLLEELETHAVVVRHRRAPSDLTARVRLSAPSAA